MREFQRRVRSWVEACFGEVVAADRVERNYRYLEEAIELVHALGCRREDALALIDYVYSRPPGNPDQEVGDVMIALAALCNACEIELSKAATSKLVEVWERIDVIRAKWLRKKVRTSPLP